MLHTDSVQEPVKKKWTLERIDEHGDGSETTQPMEGEHNSRRAAQMAVYSQAAELRALAPGPGGTISPVNIISPSGKRTRIQP